MNPRPTRRGFMLRPPMLLWRNLLSWAWAVPNPHPKHLQYAIARLSSGENQFNLSSETQFLPPGDQTPY